MIYCLKKLICCLVPALLLCVSLGAQTTTEVSGRVVDPDNLELPGVNVFVKGTTNGTTTDINGNYVLRIPNTDKAVLVFSFMGMETKEMPVAGQSKINLMLKYSAMELDEIVAIGYGTTTRKDLTGSVSSIKASDIEKLPVSNVAQALAGKIAGVQVTQAQGSPDAEISIRVRGGSSITQSNEPLYVIDGFITTDGLRGIDPSDIETIDVLKDASSTAIYGSRGSNGVILVTTKGGKAGKMSINYDMYIGAKFINKELSAMKPYDFVKLEYERANLSMSGTENWMNKFNDTYGAFDQIGELYSGRAGVNWQNEAFGGTPMTQMHKIGFSGGNEVTRYNVSYTYNNDGGIMEGSGLERHSVRLKLDQKITKAIRFSATASYTDETTEGMGSLTENGRFSRLRHIIQYRPSIGKNGNDQDLVNSDLDPVFSDDSGNVMQNPITSMEGELRTNRNKILQLNGSLTIDIIKGLQYQGSFGYRTRGQRLDEFMTMRSLTGRRQGAPSGLVRNQEWGGWLQSQTLSYNNKWNDAHSFGAMVGFETASNRYKMLTTSAKGFPEENFGTNDMGLGSTPEKPQSDLWQYTSVAAFGRFNYSYKDKYLFTATFRADGSSKFADGNKWGFFPSASFAWRASEENFIKNLNTFSNLKLRLSYGTAGNSNMDPYQYLPSFQSSWTPVNNASSPVFYSSLANSGLKWETNISANIGLDLGFFHERLQVTIDLYSTTTQDLLLNAKVPFSSGFESVMKNVGKTRNQGIELGITSYNIQNRHFSWSTSLNLSMNSNKVIKLADASFFTWKSGWGGDVFNQDDYMIREGEPLGQMWGYETDGIYTVNDFDYVGDKYVLKEGVVAIDGAQPGSWKFKDIDNTDGKKRIDSKDMKVIGHASPVLYGGLTNNFTYRGFDLSIFLNFSVGNDVYNANKLFFTKADTKHNNVLQASADRFTYIDEQGNNVFNNPAELARINQGKSMPSVTGSSNVSLHSWAVEDGSYLRISNVTLGYTLPKMVVNKIRLSSWRFYVSGQNLYTFTKYSGYDPEVNTKPNGNLTPGVDWGAYPRSLSLVFGTNISF